jgi:hypothetical protein
MPLENAGIISGFQYWRCAKCAHPFVFVDVGRRHEQTCRIEPLSDGKYRVDEQVFDNRESAMAYMEKSDSAFFVASKTKTYELIETSSLETPYYRRDVETGEWEYMSGGSWESIGQNIDLDKMLEELKQGVNYDNAAKSC